MKSNNGKVPGRPRKLASLRVYISASSTEEYEFMRGLEKRKCADVNFNIGAHLIALAIEGAKAANLPANEVELSKVSIERLTASISETLTRELSKSVVLSGITSMMNSQGDENKALIVASSITNVTKASVDTENEKDLDEEPVIPQSIIEMKNRHYF
jgi:hypothetical protein